MDLLDWITAVATVVVVVAALKFPIDLSDTTEKAKPTGNESESN